MKKVLLLLVLILFSGAAFAADTETSPASKYTQGLRNISQKLNKASDDIDAQIAAQQKKAEEQQQKYEAEKAARDAKILEQQKQRKEAYEAAQKRLEEKREQLRILLEE